MAVYAMNSTMGPEGLCRNDVSIWCPIASHQNSPFTKITSQTRSHRRRKIHGAKGNGSPAHLVRIETPIGTQRKRNIRQTTWSPSQIPSTRLPQNYQQMGGTVWIYLDGRRNSHSASRPWTPNLQDDMCKTMSPEPAK